MGGSTNTIAREADSEPAAPNVAACRADLAGYDTGDGWQADLRLFALTWLMGFVFFLVIVA